MSYYRSWKIYRQDWRDWRKNFKRREKMFMPKLKILCVVIFYLVHFKQKKKGWHMKEYNVKEKHFFVRCHCFEKQKLSPSKKIVCHDPNKNKARPHYLSINNNILWRENQLFISPSPTTKRERRRPHKQAGCVVREIAYSKAMNWTHTHTPASRYFDWNSMGDVTRSPL